MGSLSHLIQLLSRGFYNTILLTALSLPPALALGFAVGLARVYLPPIFSKLLDAVADAVRGFPLLALLYALIYGLPEIGLNAGTLQASVVALTVCSSAYISEYVKTVLLASTSKEILAARSLGMSKPQEIRYVVLPNLIRKLIPAITNEAIYMLHSSTLAGLVGVYELFSAAKTYISMYFDAWTPLILVTGTYVCTSLLFSVFLSRVVAKPGFER